MHGRLVVPPFSHKALELFTPQPFSMIEKIIEALLKLATFEKFPSTRGAFRSVVERERYNKVRGRSGDHTA